MIWSILGIILISGTGCLGVLHLPSGIQKCSLSDPDFNSCMAESITQGLQAFKKGSKDFGFPVIEPFHIKKMEIEAESGTSITLSQVYENVKLYNISDSKVVKYSRKADNNTCKWEMELHTPMTRMESDYQLTGQILVFPINGHGKSIVTLYGIVNQQTVDCEQYTKKGKLYEKLKNYKMNISVENCTFQFDNLFPGNGQISNELQKAINENSLEIFHEVKSGIEKALAKLHEDCANSVLTRMPLDQLFLP